MITDKPNKLRTAVLIILVIAFAFILFFIFRGEPSTHGIYPLAEHWTVEMPDLTYEDIALADATLGTVESGDLFVMHHTLPDEEVTGAALQIQTVHATLSVLIDGKTLFEDGSQYVRQGLMTPTLFYFIPLPEGYAGRNLTIHLQANDDSAFSGLQPVFVGNIHALYLYYIGTYRMTLVSALFLCVTGLIMLFVFFFLWNYYQLELRMVFSALISFFLGTYILSYHELADFLNKQTDLNDFMEYLSLFVLPFLFISFLGSGQDKKDRKPYYIMAIADISLLTVILFLHFTNVVHLNRCVTLMHIVILTEGAVLIALGIRTALRYRQKRHAGVQEEAPTPLSDRVLLLCFIVLIVFCLIDIIRYMLRRYLFTGGSTYATLTFIILGAMIFVVGLFVNFFYYHIERISADRTTARLAGLAYTDPLTGMANRSRCEKLLDELNETGGDFTVVSMDVNYLKRINDTYGHSTGDKYLVDMASYIRSAFPDAALHGRMGGDEFIVVLNGAVPDTYKACITRLKELVREKNAVGSPITYGISYGVAYTFETKERTLQAAFEIADERMYEMKKIKHAQEDANAK